MLHFSDERAKYFEWHNNFHQKLSKILDASTNLFKFVRNI